MREDFQNAHPLIQLGILILAGFGAMFILMVLAFIPFFLAGVGLEAFQDLAGTAETDPLAVLLLKSMQIAQGVGLFFVPFLLYRLLTRDHTYSFSFRAEDLPAMALFAFCMLSAFPLINVLAEWNSNLHLPEVFSGIETWIRETETQAEELIRIFLRMDTVSEMLFNMFLIALVPAIAEEVFFRGFMQPVFLRVSKNYHIAVWLTAFFFSFFHLQFLGFVPRFVLGAVLGYAAHWSGTLWLPMIGHFMNNGLAVLVAWYIGVEALEADFETFGANEGQWYMGLMSALLLAGCMYMLYRLTRRSASDVIEPLKEDAP